MKQYKLIFAGEKKYFANTENEAINLAEQDIKNIPSKLNIDIFSISEIN